MRKQIKHTAGIIALLLFNLCLFAQQRSVSINQSLNPEGWSANLTNPGTQELELGLRVSIEAAGARIKAWPERKINLIPGSNRLELDEYLEQAKQLIKNSGSPSFTLTGCLEVVYHSERLTKSCQEMPILPVLPPHLVYPFDGDELLTPLPSFSWTAPGPIRPVQPIYYKLKVVELMGYYTAKVAISTLPAFYQQEGLREQVHPYTGRGQAFQIGKVYAWQIEARTAQGADLGRSEVWTFSLAGPEEEEEDNLPFVELKQKYDAGYYPAYGKVKFRFDCRYGEKGPVYKITNQQGDPLKVSRDRLEKKGENLFVLTIPPGSGFIEGQYYFMEVEDGKGSKSKLMFRYYYGK